MACLMNLSVFNITFEKHYHSKNHKILDIVITKNTSCEINITSYEDLLTYSKNNYPDVYTFQNFCLFVFGTLWPST